MKSSKFTSFQEAVDLGRTSEWWKEKAEGTANAACGELDNELVGYVSAVNKLHAEITRLKGQRDRQRRYLRHSPGCEAPGPCTCGLDELIAECEAP